MTRRRFNPFTLARARISNALANDSTKFKRHEWKWRADAQRRAIFGTR